MICCNTCLAELLASADSCRFPSFPELRRLLGSLLSSLLRRVLALVPAVSLRAVTVSHGAVLIGNVSTFRVLLPGGCWPCGARAVVVLLFSPLFFYEFSIKAPPQSPPGVQRSLLTLSGGLDVPPVDVRTFSYAWIAWAVQRGRSRPNRSQIAAVFHFGIEIFLLSKRPCSAFPELCACARWFVFMHAIAGRSSARALRLTSSWPRLQP